MMEFFDNIISLFNYKKRVKYFIERNPSMGFFFTIDGKIGDIYGQSCKEDYLSKLDFYLMWKDTIDNEWRLRTKQRNKGSEK